MNKKWNIKDFFTFGEIAFSRFLLNKLGPELTNLRGKITKGSTFESV